MKSCVHSKLDWPKIDFIVSATAPLDKSLANLAESKFNCPVLEIYGCTEAGSLASRRTVADDSWLLYEGSRLKQKADGYYVAGPNLPDDILLQDIVKPVDSRHFVLLGRNIDMVNIAGKRSSLADLNIRLNRIDGVDDGVFIAPAPGDNTVTKLTALVVAPSLTPDEIRKKLALMVDPVFLPRPLVLLDKLPRNETGKLPRTALLEILDKLRNDN
jgi:acyl-coenzyme A synthetase/AMP-(fatty) acid ligase